MYAKNSIKATTYANYSFVLQVEKLLEWQLAHPSGSAEECIEWMRQAQSKRARTE